MGLAGQLTVILFLGLPVSAFAQTVTPAKLVGTWVQGEREVVGGGFGMYRDTLIFKQDGTWTATDSAFRRARSGRWNLSAGDTLWFSYSTDTAETPQQKQGDIVLLSEYLFIGGAIYKRKT